MSTNKPRAFDFFQGLTTSRPESTTDFPVWRTLTDVRLSLGALQRRPGIARIDRFASTSEIVNFDGTNDVVTLPYNDDTLGVLHLCDKWTLSWLCNPTNLSATRPIFHNGVNISIYQDSTSSGRVVAEVTDTAAAVTTLTVTSVAAGTTVRGKLVRNGSTVTLYVNGTSSSGTLGDGTVRATSADITVGKKSSDWYLGRIEFVRLHRGVRTTTMDDMFRLTNSRAPSVVFDYVTTLDSNSYVMDRGRYMQHAKTSGSPATTATLLSVNPMPVQMIAPCSARDGTKYVYVLAGGQVFPVTL